MTRLTLALATVAVFASACGNDAEDGGPAPFASRYQALPGDSTLIRGATILTVAGDTFELTNYPDQVWIAGVAVPMQSRQTLLRDRYMQMDSALPPAYRD